jgi:hypothetical protein
MKKMNFQWLVLYAFIFLIAVSSLPKYSVGLRLVSSPNDKPEHLAHLLNPIQNEVGDNDGVEEEQDHEEDNEEDALKYPLFIIGGTQKSGTTVLAGYLAHHPNISFAARKELHFFDKTTNYKEGLSHYLSDFKTNNNTLIMGEATPFYLASRKACKRIADSFPDVKMIVLLREPASRAYSEYQMKVRRVKEQYYFYGLVEHYQKRIIHCLKEFPAKYKLIEKCLPAELTKHGRYNKFSKTLRKSQEKLKDWNKVIQLCFSPFHANHSEYCPREQSLFPYLPFPRQPFQQSRKISSHTRLSSPAICYHNESSLEEYSDYLFTPRSCWTHYKEGFELVKAPEEAFKTEIEHFKNCSHKIIYPNGTT